MLSLRCLAAIPIVAAAVIVQAQSFSSIEVKPARSADLQSRRVHVLPNGDFIATSVNVIGLISDGYGVPANPSERLSTLPSWTYSERYDIAAKAFPNSKRLNASDENSAELVRAMIQQVLAKRFHLIMSMHVRKRTVYTLRVAAGGPRLQRSKSLNCLFDTAEGGCHNFLIGFGHPLNARAVDMDDIAHYIENWTDLPVLNRTSLIGRFTMSTTGWQPMQLPPPPPDGAGHRDFTHLPTIDKVLRGLGLELGKEDSLVPIFTAVQIRRP